MRSVRVSTRYRSIRGFVDHFPLPLVLVCLWVPSTGSGSFTTTGGSSIFTSSFPHTFSPPQMAAVSALSARLATGARYSGTKIVAIGKNYSKHKVEMGGTPERLEQPLFFLKPSSSVINVGEHVVKPAAVAELHHEVELGVVVGKRAHKIKPEAWRDYVSGYVVGLDMTARDLQAKAKSAGAPWTQSKCYDTFTPLSPIIPAAEVKDPHGLELYLYVDGVQRQRGSTAAMLHKIPDLLAFTSSVMTLEVGDVILTGTPEGVGPVAPGSCMRAGITGLMEVEFNVEADTAP